MIVMSGGGKPDSRMSRTMVCSRFERRLRLGAVVAGVVSCLGCAGRLAPPAPGPATEPRASWIIRTGAPDGREREICRSDQRTPCTLEASSSGRQLIATASVYLYAAQEKTTYRGAFLANFLQGSRESQVDYVIEPRKLPTGQTKSGLVTSQPGQYEFRIALLAEVPGQMDPHQFSEVIPVRVVAPTAARAE